MLARTDEQPGGSSRDHRSFLVAITVLVSGALWLLPLSSSLWLDETGTFWLVKDGLDEAIDRSLRFGGVPPAYYVLVWATRSLLGDAEWVLRVPSLIAMSLSAWIVYRIGRRLFDVEAGLLAMLVFATSAPVAFAAADARPYAVALAAHLASTLVLVRLMDDGKARDAIAYVVCAGIAMHVHYMYALPMAVHAIYVLARKRDGSPARWRTLGGLVAGLALVGGALIPHLREIFSRSRVLAAPQDVNFEELLYTIAPPALLIGAVAGIAIARGRAPSVAGLPAGRPRALLLILGLLLFPPLTLYAVAELTYAESVFAVRYYLVSLAAFPLLFGAWLRGVEPERARRAAATATVIVAVLVLANRYGPLQHRDEDWQRASAVVNTIARPDTPVLVQPRFIESTLAEWWTEPEKADALMAPIAAYPVNGRPFPLPFELSDRGAVAYMERLAVERIIPAGRAILIGRGPLQSVPSWIAGRLAPEGFRRHIVFGYGSVWVLLFERR